MVLTVPLLASTRTNGLLLVDLNAGSLSVLAASVAVSGSVVVLVVGTKRTVFLL